jgi:hypothetical protein
MNFGKWIVVSFVLFAIFIATLVALCLREDVSLVSKDYYKEEIAYQQQLERLHNTAQLSKKPDVKFIERVGLKVVWGPDAKIDKGELKLFCPSDVKRDKQFILNSSNEQIFQAEHLRRGLYKIKLLWSMGGKEYYFEQEIFIG